MLLSLKNVSLHIGTTALLDKASLTLDAGERLCLMGRNGAGKSTLLKVIAGAVKVDAGEIQREQGLTVAQLPQDVPSGLAGTVYDVVAEGLGEIGRLIARYHHLIAEGAEDLAELSRVQTALEAQDGWALESRVETMLSKLKLDGAAAFAALSGGVKRRVLLARALVAAPDLLLLDEPTNHLDIESIRWLEDFLLDWNGTLLFITHDRAFVRRLATRIVEIDRGTLQSWSGNYDEYLKQKADALYAEGKQNALFDRRLAEEEVWIRKGIEARRTRDQGRVQRLLAMREQYSQRRNLPGEARLVLQEADRSGRLVADLERASFARGDRPIVRNLSTMILRGDKVGIIGPNGAGKTTLLNLLLGKLAPDSGRVKLGTKQEIAYFDQLRAQLDDDQPVFEAIGNGREFVEIDGARKHVMSYLQEFLFTPDRARSPVRALSGGERSRLLLARLFSVPSNIIVLDEPTNDLDVETLDLLEELLIDYSGTVLLVSHDREFLDNVVTRCLVFEGHGHVGDYVGGYQDWLRQTGQLRRAPGAPIAPMGRSYNTPNPRARDQPRGRDHLPHGRDRPPVGAPHGRDHSPHGRDHLPRGRDHSPRARDRPPVGAPHGRDFPAKPTPATPAAKPPGKLSHKDQRELEELPRRIEKLESEQAVLSNQLSDPDLYTSARDKVRALQDRATAIERELGEAYRRWEALEQQK